ncbi:histone [Candidatus Micrarchaeota archaeon]|nr:MAG: histone [Candidatus Micrarchaeota archaeon]
MAKRASKVSEHKEGRILPRAPMERLIRRVGADRVSKSAVEALAEVLEERGLSIAARASLIAQHAGRKTVTPTDIEIAKG